MLRKKPPMEPKLFELQGIANDRLTFTRSVKDETRMTKCS
jgi:hypothetical protein